MHNQVLCEVHPGQFSSEYAIIVRSFTGRMFSLFAPRQDVEVEGVPTLTAPSRGWLKVNVVQRQNDLCLIELPRSTMENGPLITVPRSLLRNPVHVSSYQGQTHPVGTVEAIQLQDG